MPTTSQPQSAAAEPADFAEQTYSREQCAVFLRTEDQWGGFSNRAGGFELVVNGVRVPTSEHLFQVCKYPRAPRVQREILAQPSPLVAKMKARKTAHQPLIHPDWEQVHLDVMRWCLRVKLAQHPARFGGLLLASGDRPIVEQAPRPGRGGAYWAARLLPDGSLRGRNVMGHLLMELRAALREQGIERLRRVAPPTIPGLLLLGEPVRAVEGPLSAGRPVAPVAGQGARTAAFLPPSPRCPRCHVSLSARSAQDLRLGRPTRCDLGHPITPGP